MVNNMVSKVLRRHSKHYASKTVTFLPMLASAMLRLAAKLDLPTPGEIPINYTNINLV